MQNCLFYWLFIKLKGIQKCVLLERYMYNVDDIDEALSFMFKTNNKTAPKNRTILQLNNFK